MNKLSGIDAVLNQAFKGMKVDQESNVTSEVIQEAKSANKKEPHDLNKQTLYKDYQNLPYDIDLTMFLSEVQK